MRKINMDDIQEAGEFRRPTAGAYICVITDVIDIPEKEYLKVGYDIDSGEFKGYYTELREAHPDWAWCGAYVKSYKQTALSLFKRFCSAVSKSNGSYVFDAGQYNSEEQTLVGKKIGLVFQEEEYYGNDGSVKTRLKVFREFPIDKLDEQRVPDKKLIQKETPTAANAADVFVKAGIDEELPFA